MERTNAHPKAIDPKPLLKKLARVGLSPQTARSVLADYPLERIARQLSWLPHRNAKNPAGLLLRAIRDDWSKPLGQLEKPTSVEAGKRSLKSPQTADETKQKLARIKTEQAKEKQRRQKLVALEKRLSPSERAALKKQAESQVRRRLRSSWPKGKPIPLSFLQTEYFDRIEKRFANVLPNPNRESKKGSDFT